MSIAVTDISCGHEGYEYGEFKWIKNKPDSAGGVSVRIDFKNTGTKTINYISFGFIPYNAVGDAVGCSISKTSEKFVKYTGPLAPNKSEYNMLYKNAWYNPSITSVKLSRATIQYADGTEETISGSSIPTTAGGCYVATAVYGSYDCPEVWILRRYRDNQLAKKWSGRLFIHTYYAISPTLVKWFGDTKWFKNMWKPKLDKMVRNLRESGVDDTPYNDIEW